MGGLILIFIFGLWFTVCIYWAKQAPEWFGIRRFKWVVSVLLFTLLLPVPLVDEIVGGWQFKKLCEKNTAIKYDVQKISGSTIYYDPVRNISVPNFWLPISRQQWRHVYPNGELAMQYDSLNAYGGRLVRTIGVSESQAPLLFSGTCYPSENLITLLKSLNVTTLDRPR